jgi:hypothetical protein
MENVLKRGRTVWDRALLPEDEYVERVRLTRAAMADAGLDALVAIGHSAHTGNFTYLSGNVPPLGWMAVVLGAEAGPFLVSGGGPRDVPFLRTQTWIDEIRTSPSLHAGPAPAVGALLVELLADDARVGLAGAREDLGRGGEAELRAALGTRYEVVDVDDLLPELRAVKRPRELVAIQRSLAVAAAAVAAALDAWDDGASTTAALIAAEAAARHGGARDVRVLGNVGGEWLAPVEEHADDRGDHLVVFCAVERLGYWSQACGDSGDSGPARAAVDAMIAAAAPGVATGTLVAAAQAAAPDVAVAYGLGGGIGLDAEERPRLAAGGAEVVPDGAVLALQAFSRAGDRLTAAGAMVRVADGGAVAL